MTPQLLDMLRWFASVDHPGQREATAETAPVIAELMAAGLVFRNFDAYGATYDITPAGQEALNA